MVIKMNNRRNVCGESDVFFGRRHSFFIPFAAALLFLIAAGRVTALVYSHVAVDISYAAWVSTALQYTEEVLQGAKNALGYSAIAWAVWHMSFSAGLRAAAVFFAGLVAENVARFLIDYASSALVYYGAALALAAVGLQLLFETVLLVVAFLVVWRLKVRHDRGAETFATCAVGARTAVLLPMAVRLVEEVVYLTGFLRQYGGMTLTETASATAAFLRILVIYGGVALLLCEVALWGFGKMWKQNKEIYKKGE